jgi:hypothetical protein
VGWAMLSWTDAGTSRYKYIRTKNATRIHIWDPTMYAKCGSVGLMAIPDVMDHVSECHSFIYCDRCDADFRTPQEKAKHSRNAGCEVRPLKERRGYGDEAIDALHLIQYCKKPVLVRWAAIYRAVCNTMALPSHPYVEVN